MQKTLQFKVTTNTAENIYEITVPKIGQLIEIERLKAALTGGQYGAMISNRTLDAKDALDNIDMMANLTVLCPKLIEGLKVNDWQELDPFDFKQLKKAYDTQFIKWYAEFKLALRSVDDDK